MVHYLPSTQAHTCTTPQSEIALAATQRATLRHNLWCDNKHLRGRNEGKLHPNHIAFLVELAQDSASLPPLPNSSLGSHFVGSTFKDVLDALVALDRLDGGFSFFVRVPGALPTNAHWNVDCYSPPREMLNPRVQHHVRTLIDYFVENIAFQHTREIQDRSIYSPAVMTAIPAAIQNGGGHFPSPIIAGTCHYQYACRSMVSSTVKGKLQVSAARNISLVDHIPGSTRIFKSPRDEAPHGALISIGPMTDSVLKVLNIPAQIIPHLRFLIRFTSSRRWATELQNGSWGLSSDEAAKIAHALITDLEISKASNHGITLGEADETPQPGLRATNTISMLNLFFIAAVLVLVAMVYM